jgi:MYXO-CTERM domain-containing protein
LTPLPPLLALLVAAPLSRGDLEVAAAEFATAHPGARLVRAAAGGLEHASGLAVPRAAAGDEENARAFLAREGRAFGVGAATDLEPRRVWTIPGRGGTAVFRRVYRGLPVFGGEVAVGWRAGGVITVVNGSRALAVGPGREFRVDADGARAAALVGVPGTVEETTIEQGWLQYGGALWPAYRVLVTARAPLGSFVAYVDGETGRLFHRLSRARDAACSPAPESCGDSSASPSACICAYRASPLDPPPPPASSTGNAPEAFPVQGLVAPAPGEAQLLTGVRTSVYDCQGKDADYRACSCGGSPGPGCAAQLATADPAGNFLAEPDLTLLRVDDPFAEQSAYFHIDAHSSFLDALDPAGFGARTPAGGVGFVPALVNVRSGGAPYDNALFSPTGGPLGSSGLMVFGQGTQVDLAYDGEIIYHELTHAAVAATAGFEETLDVSGADVDPGSLNEGTADTFASAHVLESLAASGADLDSASCLSRYFGAQIGLACLRQAANSKTCRGNGPNDGRNPGRDGEVHDDGEIWTGFTWPLLRAAYAAGSGRAVAQALFLALEAVGPHPSFEGYARTVRQEMADGGLPQEALDFADCTILQRDMAGCSDRAVALFSGERALGAFFGVSGQAGTTVAGQQYFVDVPCDATALHVRSGDTTGQGGLYLRYGAPVAFDAPGLGTPRYDWAISGSHPDLVLTPGSRCEACDACDGSQTPFGAGRWYFLPRGPAQDAGGGTNVFELGVSLEVAAGQAPPARPTWLIGAAPADPSSPIVETNVCAWGRTGATPANPNAAPPASATALPALECAGPGAGAVPAQCSLPSSGCGCASGAPGGTALALLALLALGRRAWPQAGRPRRPGRSSTRPSIARPSCWSSRGSPSAFARRPGSIPSSPGPPGRSSCRTREPEARPWAPLRRRGRGRRRGRSGSR